MLTSPFTLTIESAHALRKGDGISEYFNCNFVAIAFNMRKLHKICFFQVQIGLFRSQSDIIGSISTGLCAIHCAATPLLFVAQSCSTAGCCDASPPWWNAIDYLFIGITFFAVYWSAKNSAKSWVQYALYGAWVFLTLLILNEKADVFIIHEGWKYASALSLMALHFYNRRYCQCEDAACQAMA